MTVKEKLDRMNPKRIKQMSDKYFIRRLLDTGFDIDTYLSERSKKSKKEEK